eukprot:6224581-Amphidinium_carterae.1
MTFRSSLWITLAARSRSQFPSYTPGREPPLPNGLIAASRRRSVLPGGGSICFGFNLGSISDLA